MLDIWFTFGRCFLTWRCQKQNEMVYLCYTKEHVVSHIKRSVSITSSMVMFLSAYGTHLVTFCNTFLYFLCNSCQGRDRVFDTFEYPSVYKVVNQSRTSRFHLFLTTVGHPQSPKLLGRSWRVIVLRLYLCCSSIVVEGRLDTRDLRHWRRRKMYKSSESGVVSVCIYICI